MEEEAKDTDNADVTREPKVRDVGADEEEAKELRTPAHGRNHFENEAETHDRGVGEEPGNGGPDLPSDPVKGRIIDSHNGQIPAGHEISEETTVVKDRRRTPDTRVSRVHQNPKGVEPVLVKFNLLNLSGIVFGISISRFYLVISKLRLKMPSPIVSSGCVGPADDPHDAQGPLGRAQEEKETREHKEKELWGPTVEAEFEESVLNVRFQGPTTSELEKDPERTQRRHQLITLRGHWGRTSVRNVQISVLKYRYKLMCFNRIPEL